MKIIIGFTGILWLTLCGLFGISIMGIGIAFIAAAVISTGCLGCSIMLCGIADYLKSI